MSRPVYSPQARPDLLELWFLITASSGSARADAFIEQLEEKCDLLAASPRMGVPDRPGAAASGPGAWEAA